MSVTVETTPAAQAVDPIFEQCFKITVGEEGGLSTDRSDPGNWTGGKVGSGVCKGTKFGISAASYPKLDIANLTVDQVKYPIYYPKYYIGVSCHVVPGPLACLMFDASVNNGVAHPVPWLQQCVGAAVDGKFGPETKAKVDAYNGKGLQLLVKFQATRLRFMAGLALWPKEPGWADRLFTLAYAAQGIKNV